MAADPNIVKKDGRWVRMNPLYAFNPPSREEVAEQKAARQLKKNLKSRSWRLNNLYWIVGEHPVTKTPQKIKFKPNWAQTFLIQHLWYFNIILKARQLGFTTFICILFLDTALFRPNTHCGIIAHNREDAEEFFSNKIRYAYNNLPEALRDVMGAQSDSAKKLSFSNGSSIRVGTSLRSGTFYMLHISEFGKVCARFPAKAKEIVTGGINTIHKGGFIFIESTAEGRIGYFHDFYQAARKRSLQGKKLNQLQYKDFFFPWWKHPQYRLAEKMPVKKYMADYFEKLANEYAITLDDEQKNWYIAKEEQQQDDMQREFPSTPEEAFAASIVGAYYSRQMMELRKQKRLTIVPYEPMYPVNVSWDIGYNDKMALWFHQRVGVQNRLIHYFEKSGEGLKYFVDYMCKLPYTYGTQFMPHDGGNHSAQTGESFEQYARNLGVRNIRIVPRAKNQEEVQKGIEAVRVFLGTCYIDEIECAAGVDCLDNYRKKWDANLEEFQRKPLHNDASNGADSLRCLAVGFKSVVTALESDLVPEHAVDV